MHRRDFLKTALGTATVVSLGGAVPGVLEAAGRRLAGSSGERILVMVQLSGGNDGLNTVVPYADDAYARNRFSLRLGAGQVLRLDDYLGLHPRLTGLHELWEEQKLAIVQGVGYPNPNRSHFESMDIWHTALTGTPVSGTGWLGRWLDASVPVEAQSAWALHVGGGKQPLALAGERVRVPSISSPDLFRLLAADDAALLERIESASAASRDSSGDLLNFLARSTTTAITSSQQVQAALSNDRGRANYPGRGLARQLRTVAQLIEANLGTRIYYLTLDGFDTHADQADAHAGLMNELGTSVRAFLNDIDGRGHGDRVTLAVFSEFGRRVRENASQGTDHGAAAPMFVAGGAVSAGLLGRYPSLTDLDDGDLKYTVDFRSVYAGLLQDWLGCETDGVLGDSYQPLKLFKS
jgi:uncharacterized protein (DUF1501 family)